MSIELHQHAAIFRRVYPNLTEIKRRARDVIGDLGKENKTENLWTMAGGSTLEFGAVQREDDKKKWQGRPHDLKAFDEITEFTLSQFIFMSGWNRTIDPGQRARVIATGNPPIDEAGGWVIEHWGPWLNPDHPHPAQPGELRWYATPAGENETEFPNGGPHIVKGETIYPRSRTFIPAKVTDNPYYAHDTHYLSILQSLPEPLRSQMLYGDFRASAIPNPWQVIPTEWVRLAQARWRDRDRPEGIPISGTGIDPARGGRDYATLANRYDNYFDIPVKWPGAMAKDGPTLMGMVAQSLGDKIPVIMNIDIGGIGSSVYDSAWPMYSSTRVVAVNFAGRSAYRDRSKKYKMRNIRAELYWRMRDALDPIHGDDIALPPGNEVLADLCSARYKVTTAGVQIESKDEIKARIGRSPDVGEAIILSNLPDRNAARVAESWQG